MAVETLDDERAVLLATKCGKGFTIGDMIEELAKQRPDMAKVEDISKPPKFDIKNPFGPPDMH